MTNPMKLTLGQAAKEVGISKPSLSAAIKKGRLSAVKNESGAYQIEPAELFRVYPPKPKANSPSEQEALSGANPKNNTQNAVLDLLLAERDKLIEAKNQEIQRIIRDKEKIEDLLKEQTEQAKRITLLLENKSSGAGEWQQSLKALEERISNQEDRFLKEKQAMEQEAGKKMHRLRRALEQEQNKTFWQRIFGDKKRAG